MNDATNLANRILQDGGHLIIAFAEGPKPVPEVGSTAPGPIAGVPGPFFILARATAEEYIEQTRRYNPRGVSQARRDAARAIAFFKLTAE